MQNAIIGRLYTCKIQTNFALDKSRAKMLTLGRAQTSLNLPSLNRIIVTVILFKPTFYIF